jgi:hypothetical protein
MTSPTQKTSVIIAFSQKTRLAAKQEAAVSRNDIVADGQERPDDGKPSDRGKHPQAGILACDLQNRLRAAIGLAILIDDMDFLLDGVVRERHRLLLVHIAQVEHVLPSRTAHRVCECRAHRAFSIVKCRDPIGCSIVCHN